MRKKASLQRGVTEKDTIACFLGVAQLVHISLLCEFYIGVTWKGVLALLAGLLQKGNGNNESIMQEAFNMKMHIVIQIMASSSVSLQFPIMVIAQQLHCSVRSNFAPGPRLRKERVNKRKKCQKKIICFSRAPQNWRSFAGNNN